MNKGDEFFELLSPIQIDSTMDSDMINIKLQPICNWLFQNTPTKLYRFVSVNERSIKQLINDEVWGSRASTFNDPFECLPSVDSVSCTSSHFQADSGTMAFIPF